jgi:hypothetical protein
MVEKNLLGDNRYLRGKIHFLEREKTLFKESIENLNRLIKVLYD